MQTTLPMSDCISLHFSCYSRVLHISEFLPFVTFWWQARLLLSTPALQESFPPSGFLLWLCLWLEHAQICKCISIKCFLAPLGAIRLHPCYAVSVNTDIIIDACWSDSCNETALISQGASRTAEDGERERRTGDERDERIGGAPRGSASRGLPSGPTSGAANRVRNGPDQAISNPASRVQQSGQFKSMQNFTEFLNPTCLLMSHIM